MEIPQDVGKTEAVELIRKTVENSTAHELNSWVKACRHLPTFARPGHPHKSKVIFNIEGLISYNWKKQEGEVHQRGSYASLEEVHCQALSKMDCMALVSGDMVTNMVTNMLSNLLMSDTLRTSHGDPSRVDTIARSRRAPTRNWSPGSSPECCLSFSTVVLLAW